MKRSAALICILFFCAATVSWSSDQKPTKLTSDKTQILDIERRWAEQVVTNDVETLKQILADDYIGTEPNGKRQTTAEAIAEAKAGPSEFASNHLNDDVKVRIYGNFAIAQGTETFKRKDATVGRFIWTDVFAKRNGRWFVIASQDLEVAGEK